MTQITKMDRASAKRINAAALEALEMVAEDLGLTVTVNGGRFDAAGTFKPRVEFAVAGAESAAFERDCELVGLEASDFEREFEVRGTTYRITGVNLRARRFPVQAVRVSDGKGYKFPEATVQTALGRPVRGF